LELTALFGVLIVDVVSLPVADESLDELQAATAKHAAIAALVIFTRLTGLP